MEEELKTKDNEERYALITIDLDKLVKAKRACEKCIDFIGTDKDNLTFRQSMTISIREATQLCRSIKSNFNKITDAENKEIQESQQRFITLHSELKDAVSKIKIKTKQFSPKKQQQQNGKSQNGKQHLDDDDHNDKPKDIVVEQERILNLSYAEYAEEQRIHNDQYEKNELNNMQQKLDDMKQVFGNLKLLKEQHQQNQGIVDNNDDDPNIVVKEILKEGWLDKKSRWMKSWRKRWVCIDKNTEDMTLFTFKHDKEYKNPTESLIIDENIEINPKDATENEFTLYNKATKNKFTFKASDRKDRKEWMEMILKCKQYNNQQDNAIIATQNMQNIQNILIHQHDNNNNNNMEDKPKLELELELELELNVDQHLNNDDKNYVSFNLCQDENENNEQDFQPGAALKEDKDDDDHGEDIEKYDKSHNDVIDCLELIDDLTHIDDNQKEIMIDFENSLNERGYVTKEEIDKLRDVAIKLISSLFDQET